MGFTFGCSRVSRCGRCWCKKRRVVKVHVEGGVESDGLVCGCGKEFVPGALFCSMCGARRNFPCYPSQDESSCPSDAGDAISIGESSANSSPRIYVVYPEDVEKQMSNFSASPCPSAASPATSRRQSGSGVNGVDSDLKLENMSESTSNADPSSRRSSFIENTLRARSNSFISAQSSSIDTVDSVPSVPSEDMLLLQLAQALKCSGSLARQSVDIQVLLTPDDILGAHSFPLQVDKQMPVIKAKIDYTNLFPQLPSNPIKNNAQLCLQQVFFTSMDWLGIRLEQGSPDQCMQFALCATTLMNINCKNSRSVFVGVRGEKQVEIPGFACAPLSSSDKKNGSLETFIQRMDELSDLADIIMNEGGQPQKKVSILLDKWCKACHKQLVEPEVPERDSKKTFSLNSIFGKLEEQLTALTPDNISVKKKKSLDLPDRGIKDHRPNSGRGSKQHSPRSPKSPVQIFDSAVSGGEEQQPPSKTGRSGERKKSRKNSNVSAVSASMPTLVEGLFDVLDDDNRLVDAAPRPRDIERRYTDGNIDKLLLNIDKL